MMLRTLSDRTTERKGQVSDQSGASNAVLFFFQSNVQKHTFIFANVLQCEGQAGIFPLHDSNFSESAPADDSQETEVIEVHLGFRGCQQDCTGPWSPPRGSRRERLTFAVEIDGLSLTISHRSSCRGLLTAQADTNQALERRRIIIACEWHGDRSN